MLGEAGAEELQRHADSGCYSLPKVDLSLLRLHMSALAAHTVVHLDTLTITNLQVIEFGAGDGGPVLASLSGSGFQGIVHGFEINERAASIARNRAAEYGLQKRYQVPHTPHRGACITHLEEGVQCNMGAGVCQLYCLALDAAS